MSWWTRKSEAPAAAKRGPVERLWAFLGGGPEPPPRERMVKIIDDRGEEVEVYAPPGNLEHFDRWPWP